MSTNPYQPPVVIEEPLSELASKRPAAATVFGVLNILFGITGLCGTLASGVLMSIPQLSQDNPALELMEDNAVFRIFNQISIGISFIACIVMIVAGIGLWPLKPYGRMTSIGYSVAMIILNLIGNVINFAVLFPGLMGIAAEAGGGPVDLAVYFGIGAGLLGSCMGFIYPGLLLYFMYRPNVVAAFRTMTKSE